jgi:hypothetical protein
MFSGHQPKPFNVNGKPGRYGAIKLASVDAGLRQIP